MTKKIPQKFMLVQALTVASAGVLSLVLAGSAHADENRLRTYIANDTTWPVDETMSSNTSSVSYDSSPGTSFPVPTLGYSNSGDVAGLADFGVLRGQAYASAHGDNENTDAYMNVQTSFTAFVNAAAPPVGGGPGLNFGDNVSINLSFSLDGILNSGAADGDNTASTDMSADLRIVDPNIRLDCNSPDGCITPRLVDFNGGAHSTSYGYNGETYNSWGWDLETRNGLDELINSQSDSDSWMIGPGATCSGPVCNDINFDTGTLSTTIDTTIGAELDIYARLILSSSVFNYQGDGGFGSADFFDTYGLLLTPVTEGVELSYNITPVSEVPVPAAVWLFASGLVGLVSVARRKKL